MVHLLLQCFATSAVAPTAIEFLSFKQELEEIDRQLGTDPSAQSVSLIARSAVETLSDYNLQTSKALKEQASESQRVINMLATTLRAVSTASEKSMAELKNIESQLQQAFLLEDIRMLKSRLFECLEHIEQETERQRHELAKTIAEAGEQTTGLPISPEISTGVDPITGLPSRVAAVNRLNELIRSGSRAYIGLFLLERFHSIHRQLGDAARDHIVLWLWERLQQLGQPGDQVFRWGPAGFVGVFMREYPMVDFRRTISTIIPDHYEMIFESEQRTTLIMLSTRSVVTPAASAGSADRLISIIDQFFTSS